MGQHAFAILLIFLGGGIGSILRHLVNQTCAALFGVNLAWGTIVVNILGSFMMGLLAGWFEHGAGGGQMFRLFLTTGLLGGFTTFSTFSLDALLLWDRGDTAAAVMYVVASVGLAIIGIAAGMVLSRSLLT